MLKYYTRPKSAQYDDVAEMMIYTPDTITVIDGDDEPLINTGLLDRDGNEIVRDRRRIPVGFCPRSTK